MKNKAEYFIASKTENLFSPCHIACESKYITYGQNHAYLLQ